VSLQKRQRVVALRCYIYIYIYMYWHTLRTPFAAVWSLRICCRRSRRTCIACARGGAQLCRQCETSRRRSEYAHHTGKRGRPTAQTCSQRSERSLPTQARHHQATTTHSSMPIWQRARYNQPARGVEAPLLKVGAVAAATAIQVQGSNGGIRRGQPTIATSARAHAVGVCTRTSVCACLCVFLGSRLRSYL
jgi:hypothetical protein